MKQIRSLSFFVLFLFSALYTWGQLPSVGLGNSGATIGCAPHTITFNINNVNYYHKAEDKEDYGRDYGYDDEVVIKTPSRFNNLSELIEWFNNDYIELLLVNLKELSQSYIYNIL